MAQDYADYRFALEVRSPVFADSRFESDTLWGRILCVLLREPGEGRRLAEGWLRELEQIVQRGGRLADEWRPPLLVSEGFQCRPDGEPWLPLPFRLSLRLRLGGKFGHKELKKVERVPFPVFQRLCAGEAPDETELLNLAAQARTQGPKIEPAAQPHVGLDRLSGTARAGILFLTAMHTYQPPRVAFLLRLRTDDGDPEASQAARAVEQALQIICDEGWGHAKSRGLGRIQLSPGGFEKWEGPPDSGGATAFVSLSHFCPAASDPVQGQWKLDAKHSVPSQFVEGRRVELGGGGTDWRVKSFIRLHAGSCLSLRPGDECRPYYGRMLTGLLEPAQDGDGQALPVLFHYALAYPWPLMQSPVAEATESAEGERPNGQSH